MLCWSSGENEGLRPSHQAQQLQIVKSSTDQLLGQVSCSLDHVHVGPMCSALAGEGAIDTLVLLDREVDPITPMLTQLTYEGLVDELLGISNGTVQFDVPGGLKITSNK